MRILRYTIVSLFLLALIAGIMVCEDSIAVAQEGEGDYQGIIPLPNPDPPQPPLEGYAGIELIAAVGGITDPTPGTRYYPNGTLLTIKAIPYEGFRFDHWIVKGYFLSETYSPPTIIIPDENIPPQQDYTTVVPVFVSMTVSQNPFTFDCGYGYVFSYQPVFVPTEPSAITDTIIIVKGSIGGTTNPSPGTYPTSENSAFSLTATSDEGFEFQYWVVSGSYTPGHGTGNAEIDRLIVSKNPLSINCGYGYTYTYQPIFTPTNAEIQGEVPLYLYVIIAVLVIVAVVAVTGAIILYQKKKSS